METPKLSPEVQKLCNHFHILMEEAERCKDQQTMEVLVERALQIPDEIRSMGFPVTSSFHFNGEKVEAELTVTIPQFDDDEDRKIYDKWFAEANGIAIDG